MKLKQKHFIDSHKCATAFAVLGLMYFYDRWDNTTAWVYLALHGTYGLLWTFKSNVFPDRNWERRTVIAYGLVIWGGLTAYWITPWLIISRDIEAPLWFISACIATWGFGVFWHFASDMQKFTRLRAGPGLITEGLWAKTRNPNYFGELLIYVGFSALAMDWPPLVVLACFIAFVWIPNMRRKDKSLSRYPEFAEYRKRSALLIPFLI